MKWSEFCGDRDVYVGDDFEEVMYRWDAKKRKIYRKFYGDNFETKPPSDSKLLFDVVQTGEEITKEQYIRGKPRQVMKPLDPKV